MDPPNRYFGVYFQEPNHPGYLLVRHIATGGFGIALLVLSLADGNLYVRKIDLQATRTTNDAVHAAEVRNYINHPHIPTLISYTEHTFYNTLSIGSAAIKTTSTWQFCNGGTLVELINRSLVTTTETLAEDGYPNITPGVPETFIWSFFDTILAVLITSHRAGVTHNDLHDGNIFLHWPLPDSILPDVFIGDWGNSVEYPWRTHPNRYFSTPYHISDFSDLQRPLLHYSQRIRPRFIQAPLVAVGPQPAGFNGEAIMMWYRMCRRDLSAAVTLLYTLIVSSPEAEITEPEGIQRASRQNRGVNGYSRELINAFILLGNLARRLNTEFRPFTTMQDLVRLHNDVQILRGRADRVAIANENNHANILALFRPVVPFARPELWPTQTSVTAAGDNGRVWITSIDRDWSVQLNPGQFEIRRVTRHRDGRWALLPLGRWTIDLDGTHWTVTDHDGPAPANQQVQTLDDIDGSDIDDLDFLPQDSQQDQPDDQPQNQHGDQPGNQLPPFENIFD